MNIEKIVNIINGRCLPLPLEAAIKIRKEKIICFEDSLLYGDISAKQFYDVSERFHYWQKIYEPFDLKRKRKESHFKEEKIRYDEVKKKLKSNHKIIIWYSDRPDNTLMLWSLSMFIGEYVDSDQISLAPYHKIDNPSLLNFIPMTNMLYEQMKELWRMYAADKMSIVKHESQFGTQYPFCLQLDKVASALKYTLPTISFRNTFISELDRDILKIIQNNNKITRPEIYLAICGDKRFDFIGDLYLFSRISHLEHNLHAIETAGYLDNNPLAPQFRAVF